MKNSRKLLKISFIILVLGVIFIFVGYSFGGFDYVKNNDINIYRSKRTNRENKQYQKYLDEFSEIDVNFEKVDFEIVHSENEKPYVIYNASNNDHFDISTQNNVLKIVEKSNKFNTIGYEGTIGVDVNFIKDLILNRSHFEMSNNHKFTLCIPKKSFDRINIKTDFGNVNIDSVSSKDLKVDVSFGNLNLKNSQISDLDVHIAKGDINISEIKVDTEIKLENNLGNIALNNCFSDICNIMQNKGNTNFKNIIAKDIKIENNMGNITGSLIYDDNNSYDVDAVSDMGSINIDRSFVRVKNAKENVNIKLKTNMGSIVLNREKN